MMKPLPDLFQQMNKVMHLNVTGTNSARFALLFSFFFLSLTGNLSAQTVRWSDTFQEGQDATTAQCQKWTNFLDQLRGKSFSSVTISGSRDLTGRTITDPAAATQLAWLLSSRTKGKVVSGGYSWITTTCFTSSCGVASVALSLDGSEAECSCNDTYSVRPHVGTKEWGGLNVASSCTPPTQTITLEFNSGVFITGPTTLCNNETIKLTANAERCSGTLNYEWSTGATTPSIDVSTPGDYWVTVSGQNCAGTSETITVTGSSATVDAGDDAIYDFRTPVQLSADGTSTGGIGKSNFVCIYNSPGSDQEDCEFTTTVCEEGSTYVGSSSYSEMVVLSNPIQLLYHIYYSSHAMSSTFTFWLNDGMLGKHVETRATGACDTREEKKFPQSFEFDQMKIREHWRNGVPNELRVEIETTIDDATFQKGIQLAGIKAEVITSEESYAWSPAEALDNAFSRTPLASPTATTTYVVTYTDPIGCTATDDVKVTASCVGLLSDIRVPNDPGTCVATLQLTAPTLPDGCVFQSITHDQPDDEFEGETMVTWMLTDADGNVQTATQKVIVTNDDPVISAVQASPLSVGVNSNVVVTTSFSDNNVRMAAINWGDGSPIQTVADPAKTFDVTHAYASAGIYQVSVTLTDHCDATASGTSEQITVINNGGFVKGNGWFESERGFYLKNAKASGKAQFAFEAKYQQGSSTPVGNVTFRFKAGNFQFKSTQLQSLLLMDDRATLTAAGKLNGVRDYTILMSVVDVDLSDADDAFQSKKSKKQKDHIRVKIWDPSGIVIYDTQNGDADDAIAITTIGGGSVTINETSLQFEQQLNDIADSFFGGESTSAYPNPFTDHLNIQFNSGSAEDVVVQLIDLSGKSLARAVYPVSEDGHYFVDIPENSREGIYVLIIKQGQRVEYMRLVRN